MMSFIMARGEASRAGEHLGSDPYVTEVSLIQLQDLAHAHQLTNKRETGECLLPLAYFPCVIVNLTCHVMLILEDYFYHISTLSKTGEKLLLKLHTKYFYS